MTVYTIVALVGLIVVTYFVSVLAPLPWYLYVPFVGIFILAYFWEKIIKIFPRRSSPNPKDGPRQGKRM